MRRPDLWTEKLAQAFHDPFWKAWCQGQVAKDLARWLGEELDAKVPDSLLERYAQDKVGMLLSQRMLDEEFTFPGKGALWKDSKKLAEALEAGRLPAPLMADLAATGADRPVLGTGNQVRVALWESGRNRITVTHPLAPAPLRVPAPSSLEDLKRKLGSSLELLDEYRRALAGFSGDERHKRAFLFAWRRLPEDLAREDGVFWPLQPADTRCPDHSIWDHVRVASALAFLPESRAADDRLRAGNPERRPWLLSMWVGPAREFVGLARTGRDLWTGSTMLAELAWAMIEPLAGALGPDAIVYPDLRANPRADRWLAEAAEGVLGGAPAGTRASLIPNRFVVVVPEGDLDDLTAKARRAVTERWHRMAEAVREHLADENRLGPGRWQEIFDEQTAMAPLIRWVAVSWDWDGYSGDARKIRRDDIRLPPIFPFEEDPPTLPEPVAGIEDARKIRFSGWVPRDVFIHYQAARWTFLQTHPGYLLGQRGFDYALHHHRMLSALGARKLLGDRSGTRDEPGEKCTLCGARQVLTNDPKGTVARQRQAARALWRNLDPERLGAERLCGPCSVRRYLSDSTDTIRKNWESTLHPREAGGTHRVPFPATSLVAGQRWLEALCQSYGTSLDLQRAVKDFLVAFRRSGIKRTQFAGALARLRRRLHDGLPSDLERLLEIEIQYLDPAIWERFEAAGEDAAACRDARDAASRMRRELGAPATHLAVIVLDGDRMGELLLGAPKRVRARWRDVLHPDTVDGLLEDPKKGEAPPWKRAWRSLLESERLMGPSLHAFVSRALRHFSNRILPWVVEREYGGRLIYAGGDDALILCPADEALPLLARLDELFTAPWVLDHHPEARPWDAQEPADPLYDVGSPQARARFEVVRSDGMIQRGTHGRVVPMLGPHSSFSVGATFGHFKTSLRLLRAEARRLLEEAKTAGGRRVGVTWYTRSGAKARAVVSLAGDSPGNTKDIMALARGFREGSLPGRLPYKLREVAPLVREAARLDDEKGGEAGTRVVIGIVRRALDGADGVSRRLGEVWLSSLRQQPQNEDGLGFLFFARALAGELADDGDQGDAHA